MRNIFKSNVDRRRKKDIGKVLARLAKKGGTARVLRHVSLQSLVVEDGHAFVTLEASREEASVLERLRETAEAAVAQLPGLSRATLIMTAHRSAPSDQPNTSQRPRAHLLEGRGHKPLRLGASDAPEASAGAPPSDGAPAGSLTEARAPQTKLQEKPQQKVQQKLLPQVKAIIAVASGKGGVGKSTTAVNLAAGLAQCGLRTGMLDADIYGPSLPRMLGHSEKPVINQGKIVPVQVWGITAVSIGFLIDEQQAMIWRGPMVMGAIGQLLSDVAWPALDVLVIDMPPGTGDAQLTLSQKLHLHGVVIVSTPQDIALIDARRALTMFNRLQVPILGIVENMSYFCCPNCRERTALFGHGGARAEAEKAHVPFLGEIPLLADIRASADAGTPIILSAPESEAARAYRAMAQSLAARLR